jgi:hypothetical protein
MMSQDVKSLLSQIDVLRLEADAYDYTALAYLLELAYQETLECSGQVLLPLRAMPTTTLQ